MLNFSLCQLPWPCHLLGGGWSVNRDVPRVWGAEGKGEGALASDWLLPRLLPHSEFLGSKAGLPGVSHVFDGLPPLPGAFHPQSLLGPSPAKRASGQSPKATPFSGTGMLVVEVVEMETGVVPQGSVPTPSW